MADTQLNNSLTAPPEASMEPSESRISPHVAEHLRRLSHDLSNALEVILQTNYRLGMQVSAGNEDNAKWREMLDRGVMQATLINRQMRDFIRDHS